VHSVRRERRRDSDAPEWESARPLEVYPTLRARRLPELALPPLLVAVVALALAAAVLFALPGLLGFGSPSAVSSPSPSPLTSAAAETFAPTAVPEPTPQVYIVQSGDTMSKIAKRFHVPLADLIAANAQSIPNPDRLQIGDQVTIPVPQPSELPAQSPASS
jgi:nucleoid-associated protein YgaU